MRKFRRADEITAAGDTQEEIAAEHEVSAATPHNWRREYGGVNIDVAKELKELREQNIWLKRLLADARLEKDARREVVASPRYLEHLLPVPRGEGTRRRYTPKFVVRSEGVR